MTRLLVCVASLLLGAGCAASTPRASCPLAAGTLALWPGTPPGSGDNPPLETVTERSADPKLKDRAVAGVSRPALLPYLAAQPSGAAAIIIPGGGYRYITVDKEGVDVAEWLNSLGVSAFVLKHRLPPDSPGKPWVPLSDAQRALRLLRRHAGACALDPQRLGVVGFSAGGHLASQLATRFAEQAAPRRDDIDSISAKPAFAILLYPVISMDPSIAHAGSRAALLGENPTPAEAMLYSSELQVTRNTPPTFLATSKHDGSVDPENSIRFARALAAAAVPHELHLYETSGHGTGIRNARGDMATWPAQAAAWLKASRFRD